MLRRPTVLLLATLLLGGEAWAADPFAVEAIEDASAEFPDAPHLHSFAFAQWEGKWVFIGGRTNGYHAVGGGPADFMRAEANTAVWVVDTTVHPAKTYHVELKLLPATHAVIQDQWSAAASLWTQSADKLYIAGGYGQNAAGEWLTYPILSVVALPELIAGVVKGALPAHAIRFTKSAEVQASGGQLVKIPGGDFYLAMGHIFTGSYSAFEANGEHNTAPASQTYLEEIRQLKITEGLHGGLSVAVVRRYQDAEFHRRDLNIVEVLSSKGVGFVALGGVFTPKDQSIFTKPVMFHPGESPDSSSTFQQQMNSYESARLLLYEPSQHRMYVTLFGGISGSYFDFEKNAFREFPKQGTKSSATYLDGMQWSDQVSTLAFTNDIAVREWVHERPLPAFLGTSAVFIPLPEVARAQPETRIIDLSKLHGRRTLVGYIYGGIQAFPYAFPYGKSAPPYNAGAVSSKASGMILRVYVTVPEAQ
jgi:hypothetical protein